MRNRRKKRGFAKSNKKIKIITGSAIALSLFFISIFFSLINIANFRIAKGIKVGGMDISNLTQEEAKIKVSNWYDEVVSNGIILNYETLEETINIEELDAKANIDQAIEQATKVGRSGNIIRDNYEILFSMIFGNRVNIEITFDDDKLKNKIEEISGKLPDAVVQSNYYIEDDKLVIQKGQPGIIIDKENLHSQICSAINNMENKRILIPIKETKPNEIDLEKIYSEIYKVAKDAYVEEKTSKLHAHVNGVDFAISMDEAKKILEEEKDEYEIPLKITVPSVTVEKLGWEAFPEKLSEFITRYDASIENRSNNLKLASDKINGTIVLPGETFSYNKTVGARTIAAGYKEAAVYSGGKVVQGIGGGICQLSSTLYNAVLYANLQVTNRSNHRFLTSYVEPGRDATVSWGTIDFCFKNTRNYPIKIVSSVVNGLAKVQIYGIREEKEYEVELITNIIEETPYKTTYKKDPTLDEGLEALDQQGSNGAKSETYLKLSLDGTEISKTLLSVDTYSSLEKVVRQGTKKVVEDIDVNEIEIPTTVLDGGELEEDIEP